MERKKEKKNENGEHQARKIQISYFFVKYLPVDQTLVSSNENERLSTNTIQT